MSASMLCLKVDVKMNITSENQIHSHFQSKAHIYLGYVFLKSIPHP